MGVARTRTLLDPDEFQRRTVARFERTPVETKDGDLLHDLVAKLPADGGTIRLGPGRYYLQADLTIDRPDVEIVGNREAIIDVGIHTLTMGFTGSGIRGCSVRGVAGHTAYLVVLGSTNCYLDHCYLPGVVDRQVRMDGNRTRVESCTWPDVGTDTLIYGVRGNRGITIRNNNMDGAADRALDLIFVENPTDNGGATATFVLIDNNWTESRITYPVAQTTYGDNVATPRAV